MACTNMAFTRVLRSTRYNSFQWNYFHRPCFYSSTPIFSSSSYKGRNIISIPRVSDDTWSYFLNLSKPQLYSAFVKPNNITRIQDNFDGFLSSELSLHPKLIRGQLKNGLRYCILQHEKHSNRFEAHVVVHVGSVHEEEDEQGIAHMTEHVVFSDKCRRLCDVGFELGACTRHYRTKYSFKSQTILKHFDEDLLDGELVDGDLVPLILDALNEVVFEPKIKASYLEKERHVVLSELQMDNTIDERIELQLIQHLHSENKMSKRSNILGLEEQIKKWNVAQIKKFHKRWYFPGNATLYIVGDINDVPKTIDAIKATFGKSKFKNEGMLTDYDWSLPQSNKDKKLLQIFQHNLMHNFLFCICSKTPVNDFQTHGDLRNFLMKQIFVYILHFRICAKYKSSNSSSASIELHHRDYPYDKCALTELIITSEPKDWKTTIKLAFHEIHRLKELGINNDEFTIYKNAILKDAVYRTAVLEDHSTRETVEFIMEKDALGHTIMEQNEALESLAAIAATITLEEVNSVGGKLFEFVSDFGKLGAPVPAAIMACAPHTHEEKGELIEFTINPCEIEYAIKQGLEDLIYVAPQIEVPTELISLPQLQELLLIREPSFIPLIVSKPSIKKLHDKKTNITQRRLSNGISVNYKISENERDEAVIRVIISGGRACESSDLKGAILVGVQTLLDGGCVGHFSSQQVHFFCIKNMIDYSLDCTEEFISLELSFTTRDNGMQAAFQLLHMLLEQTVWLEDAFDRATQFHMSNFQSELKSLELSTKRELMLAMLDEDEQFVKPTRKSLQNLTLQSVKDAVLNQFSGNNMEVSIVGDFSEEDIEPCIINYLGTIKAAKNSKNELPQYDNKFTYSASPSHLQSQVFLKDTEERTYTCIAGHLPNIWGFTGDGKHYLESKPFIEREDLHGRCRDHPLFFGITMEFVADMLEDGLYEAVIASGLAYDVVLDLCLFDKLNLGWYMISVASTPDKVRTTIDACKKVLKDFRSEDFYPKYVDKVRGCLLMRLEDKTKSNSYWLKLLCRLHGSSFLRKDILCIEELASLYEVVCKEDIYFAYDQLKINDNSIYSCIGRAGNLEIIGKSV